MGSMLKFDSERRELVRERRDARIERKQQRRQARERKQSPIAVAVPSAPSATQRIAEQELQAAVDRIVVEALDRARAAGKPGRGKPAASLAGPASAAAAKQNAHGVRR